MSSSWQIPHRARLKLFVVKNQSFVFNRLGTNTRSLLCQLCDSPRLSLTTPKLVYTRFKESTDHALGCRGILKLLQKFLNLCSAFLYLLQTGSKQYADLVPPFEGLLEMQIVSDRPAEFQSAFKQDSRVPRAR